MEEEKVISTQDSLTPSATVHELSENVMTGKADYSKTKCLHLQLQQVLLLLLAHRYH